LVGSMRVESPQAHNASPINNDVIILSINVSPYDYAARELNG